MTDTGDQEDPTIATDDAEAPAGKDIVTTIAQFDWLKLPGAVRALSSVVIGAGEAGSAWIDIVKAAGEQKSQAIRDTTEARSKALSAYTDAAIALGLSDPGLIKRTVDYTLVKGLREQSTREHIVIEAARIVTEDPPPADTPPPSDDWLNIFASYAEKTSSERLKAHWAAVLAGEIKQPGRFSFSSLHVLSILDPHTAALIEKTRGWLFDGDAIIMTASKSLGPDYGDLVTLSHLGLLSLGHSRTFQPFGPHARPLGAGHVLMSFPTVVKIQTAVVSKTGTEILSLAAPKGDENYVKEALEHLEKLGVQVFRQR